VLTRLAEAVRSDDSPRVYCVVGSPGVGKTAVTVHWAHRHEEHYPDGVLFADLRGFSPAGSPAEPGEVLDGFLAALGLAGVFEGSLVEGRAAAYRTAMSARRMLVVLDDAASAAHRDAARFTTAIGLYERVLAERRELGDDYGYALTLRELGNALCASGDVVNGIARLRECLDLFTRDDPNAETARRLLARYE
jgi:hypothetical protein